MYPHNKLLSNTTENCYTVISMKLEIPQAAEVALLKPFSRVLRPDFVIGDAHNLSVHAFNEYDTLKSVGLIIFDVDNTLEDFLAPELLPETVDLFERLHKAGYALAIASNCDETRGTALKDMFSGLADVVATPKDARDGGALYGKKPTTGMYGYIQKELDAMGRQFSPAQTLMVGDQILKDVLFGKRAHTKTALAGKFGEHDHPKVEKYQREHERRLLLAMGFRAIDGAILFPERLTPTKLWITANSGLIVPGDLA